MFAKFQFRIENFGFKSSSCHFAAQAVLTANFIRDINLSSHFTDQFKIPLEFDYHGKRTTIFFLESL